MQDVTSFLTAGTEYMSPRGLQVLAEATEVGGVTTSPVDQTTLSPSLLVCYWCFLRTCPSPVGVCRGKVVTSLAQGAIGDGV